MALHNSTGSISISIAASIATIEFGHPASNSFPSLLLKEQTSTIETVGQNPEALVEMKKVLWEGTAHWDSLLLERAAITGKLVLSEATKSALKRN